MKLPQPSVWQCLAWSWMWFCIFLFSNLIARRFERLEKALQDAQPTIQWAKAQQEAEQAAKRQPTLKGF